MKFSRLIKNNVLEILFVALIVLCFYVYFVIYMTPSRVAWYREMRNQITIALRLVLDLGR